MSVSEGGTMTAQTAGRIYDVLVTIGATEGMRDSFVRAMLEGCREWRFMGVLGMGGKFWPESGVGGDEWRVSCYSEDESVDRRQTIVFTNLRLRELRAAMEAPHNPEEFRKHLSQALWHLARAKEEAIKQLDGDALYHCDQARIHCEDAVDESNA